MLESSTSRLSTVDGGAGASLAFQQTGPVVCRQAGGAHMELGAFSISLTVKDIAASRSFYEKLGFAVFGGNQEQNWLIMKNGTTLIGLFQDMFDRNLLTFNPGWNSEAQALPAFTDVRVIQERLRSAGVTLLREVDSGDAGPGRVFMTPELAKGGHARCTMKC